MYETEIEQLEADIINVKSLLNAKQLELSRLRAAVTDRELLYFGIKNYTPTTRYARDGFHGVANMSEGDSVTITTSEGTENVEIIKLEEDIDYDSYGSVDSCDVYMVLKFRNNLYKVTTDADSYGTNWDDVSIQDIKPVTKIEKTVVVYSYE